MAGRRRPAEVPEAVAKLTPADLLHEALTLEPGELTTYNRAHTYSIRNQMLLRMQGVREPVCSYEGWKEFDRHVVKGASGKYIYRPITVKSKDELDENGDPKKYMRFKPVKGAFAYSDTEGEPLPEVEHPTWSKERALGALAIREVAFDQIDGNLQGFSFERNIAVSPIARYPMKTTIHELGHVVLNHTVREAHAEYVQHRGEKEFQAEGTAYIVMNELDLRDEFDPAESRAYISSWLKDETPNEQAISQVFKASDEILKAGYPQL
ncbi:ArdC-like ssDNA-binding domain-containing protein [Dietzia sp. MNB45]|uniref:ArdC-like ssDNA-binding domain-containing protein n=1 Tax=Dietzia sp. MNB45 TaxID=3238800 RepID=UPI003F80E925